MPPSLQQLAREALDGAWVMRCEYLLSPIVDLPVLVPTPVEHNGALVEVEAKGGRKRSIHAEGWTEAEVPRKGPHATTTM